MDTTIREGQIIPAYSHIAKFFLNVFSVYVGGLTAQMIKFDMKFEVKEKSEEGTSALIFHTVGKEWNPATSFSCSLIKCSDGDLVIHFPVYSQDQYLFSREEVFLPTNGTYIIILQHINACVSLT